MTSYRRAELASTVARCRGRIISAAGLTARERDVAAVAAAALADLHDLLAREPLPPMPGQLDLDLDLCTRLVERRRDA